MRAAGADVKEIQQQLGHLSPVVTLSVYTHLFEGALDPVMERLDDEHRSLAWPDHDPDVIELDHRREKKGS
jgi:integrase